MWTYLFVGILLAAVTWSVYKAVRERRAGEALGVDTSDGDIDITLDAPIHAHSDSSIHTGCDESGHDASGFDCSFHDGGDGGH